MAWLVKLGINHELTQWFSFVSNQEKK
jgi:hypothetical protein